MAASRETLLSIKLIDACCFSRHKYFQEPREAAPTTRYLYYVK